MTRALVICADDFGLAEGINQAILELIRLQRLSATSCMTTMPAWTRAAADRLLECCDQAALGLHFNLTEGEAAMPLGQLMLRSLSGQLDRRAIRCALERQLDRFEQLTGRMPDFVDGHQHVQMFPGIRQVVLDTLTRRYPDTRPWVRVSMPAVQGHDARIKALVLRSMGLGFDHLRRRHGVAGNRDFAGLYSLRPNANFGGLMQQWLQQLPDGALIMCHPGYSSDPSPLAQAREQERRWLASDAFSEALQHAGRRLTRTPELN